MGSPSQKVAKALFALCGNRCAWPQCSEPMVRENGAVIGIMCHIKGNRPGSARHDRSQSESERQGYHNLVVMCPTHHAIIDNKELEADYPEPLLRQWKLSTELSAAGHELDPAQLRFGEGYFAISESQTGGITAGRIDSLHITTESSTNLAEFRPWAGKTLGLLSQLSGRQPGDGYSYVPGIDPKPDFEDLAAQLAASAGEAAWTVHRDPVLVLVCSELLERFGKPQELPSLECVFFAQQVCELCGWDIAESAVAVLESGGRVPYLKAQSLVYSLTKRLLARHSAFLRGEEDLPEVPPGSLERAAEERAEALRQRIQSHEVHPDPPVT